MRRRPSSCCMRASARRACGAIFPTSFRPRPAPAYSSIRAPAMALPVPSRCRVRSTTCMSRRSTCCRSCSIPSAFAAGFCSAIPTARRSRRSMPAARDHRIRGLALIAPHFVVEDVSVASIAGIKQTYETTDLKSKLARWHSDVDNAFYGWNGAWLDAEIQRLGYLGIPRLYPRAGGDPAGRRRSVWDNPSDRDRPARVLLSGRCDDHSRGWTFAAS